MVSANDRHCREIVIQLTYCRHDELLHGVMAYGGMGDLAKSAAACSEDGPAVYWRLRPGERP